MQYAIGVLAGFGLGCLLCLFGFAHVLTDLDKHVRALAQKRKCELCDNPAEAFIRNADTGYTIRVCLKHLNEDAEHEP